MISSKLTPIFLYLRELFIKFIFGKIKMIKCKNQYYPINFFLPYIFSFILEYFQMNYVYIYDNINFYQDYTYDIPMFPPILSFNIDGNNMMNTIKNYKSNIPVSFFLYDNRIIKPKLITINYWNSGSLKVKNIKNLEIYNSLKDIFD